MLSVILVLVQLRAAISWKIGLCLPQVRGWNWARKIPQNFDFWPSWRTNKGIVSGWEKGNLTFQFGINYLLEKIIHSDKTLQRMLMKVTFKRVYLLSQHFSRFCVSVMARRYFLCLDVRKSKFDCQINHQGAFDGNSSRHQWPFETLSAFRQALGLFQICTNSTDSLQPCIPELLPHWR